MLVRELEGVRMGSAGNPKSCPQAWAVAQQSPKHEPGGPFGSHKMHPLVRV